MYKYFFTLLVSWLMFSCGTVAQESETPRTASATDNVVILTDSMAMPGLDRNRLLRLYLPVGYGTSTERYPVIYMHDAQNLFDDQTSFAGEWGVDEALNELAAQGGQQFIVVGIDNGGVQRMSELGPYENADFSPNEGPAYTDFLVKTVKPYVDANYRTLADREHTAIMGSSMGGLISHYAILTYPEVFSKAGIFSPSYWFSDEAFTHASTSQLPEGSRLFLLVGGKEGGNMVQGTKRMHQTFVSAGYNNQDIQIVIDPQGTHSEGFWRTYFSEAIVWLFE